MKRSREVVSDGAEAEPAKLPKFEIPDEVLAARGLTRRIAADPISQKRIDEALRRKVSLTTSRQRTADRKRRKWLQMQREYAEAARRQSGGAEVAPTEEPLDPFPEALPVRRSGLRDPELDATLRIIAGDKPSFPPLQRCLGIAGPDPGLRGGRERVAIRVQMVRTLQQQLQAHFGGCDRSEFAAVEREGLLLLDAELQRYDHAADETAQRKVVHLLEAHSWFQLRQSCIPKLRRLVVIDEVAERKVVHHLEARNRHLLRQSLFPKFRRLIVIDEAAERKVVVLLEARVRHKLRQRWFAARNDLRRLYRFSGNDETAQRKVLRLLEIHSWNQLRKSWNAVSKGLNLHRIEPSLDDAAGLDELSDTPHPRSPTDTCGKKKPAFSSLEDEARELLEGRAPPGVPDEQPAAVCRAAEDASTTLEDSRIPTGASLEDEARELLEKRVPTIGEEAPPGNDSSANPAAGAEAAAAEALQDSGRKSESPPVGDPLLEDEARELLEERVPTVGEETPPGNDSSAKPAAGGEAADPEALQGSGEKSEAPLEDEVMESLEKRVPTVSDEPSPNTVSSVQLPVGDAASPEALQDSGEVSESPPGDEVMESLEGRAATVSDEPPLNSVSSAQPPAGAEAASAAIQESEIKTESPLEDEARESLERKARTADEETPPSNVFSSSLPIDEDETSAMLQDSGEKAESPLGDEERQVPTVSEETPSNATSSQLPIGAEAAPATLQANGEKKTPPLEDEAKELLAEESGVGEGGSISLQQPVAASRDPETASPTLQDSEVKTESPLEDEAKELLENRVATEPGVSEGGSGSQQPVAASRDTETASPTLQDSEMKTESPVDNEAKELLERRVATESGVSEGTGVSLQQPVAASRDTETASPTLQDSGMKTRESLEDEVRALLEGRALIDAEALSEALYDGGMETESALEAEAREWLKRLDDEMPLDNASSAELPEDGGTKTESDLEAEAREWLKQQREETPLDASSPLVVCKDEPAGGVRHSEPTRRKRPLDAPTQPEQRRRRFSPDLEQQEEQADVLNILIYGDLDFSHTKDLLASGKWQNANVTLASYAVESSSPPGMKENRRLLEPQGVDIVFNARASALQELRLPPLDCARWYNPPLSAFPIGKKRRTHLQLFIRNACSLLRLPHGAVEITTPLIDDSEAAAIAAELKVQFIGSEPSGRFTTFRFVQRAAAAASENPTQTSPPPETGLLIPKKEPGVEGTAGD
ncbi:hypothetical protein DIPPA_17737 [Diplonema papillatum]|nr:hypothetical protein DIPPA_17737 [Diplonema papillatum]KAJ9469288.1 hypothetical protein DIPPA_17737 [Diplonema papillatum]KAJ9469290.1 hypothetical protein DIPPA_17737 [Diplonema papillatum]